jgi:hypothetical protein
MMPMRMTSIMAGLAALALAGPTDAQPAWGNPNIGPMFPDGPDHGPVEGARDPREGRIEAATFLASSPNVGHLGHGSIALAPGAAIESPGDGSFEVALADELAKAGYQTGGQQGTDQTIEFIVSHDVIRPPEPPRSPVGGAVSVGAGSRGWGGVGLGLAIDLSKPLKALIATRIEARIRDSLTHELLWQGRAQVVTREGDKRWTSEVIAARLAAALFKRFPNPSAS